ncbi:SH3 domain-containing protein [Sesbania bispinosa]|nr:SH3 domain-containing protein [Sesbania bispinosa]
MEETKRETGRRELGTDMVVKDSNGEPLNDDVEERKMEVMDYGWVGGGRLTGTRCW